MKYLTTIALLSLVLFTSCKTETKTDNEPKNTGENLTTESNTKPDKDATIVEKIALANGMDNWANIEELKFTFNVDREGSPHFERSWIWKPKTNEVTATSSEDTITYNRNTVNTDVDSTVYKTNGNFVNDKYWLLAPLNIMWDEGNTTTEHTMETEAPISKKTMQKLTVTYGQEGGYTPGDAYDFYFGDDFIVKEWVFRKANQAEPSMTTTWEDYTKKGGLQIAETHQNEEGNFKLYFTGVEAITK
ncbi:MAG TPA: hypothetical protein ENH87_13670 [Pricia antarctica]|uniref:Uncharacterized protein n=1 Tax=Pricia antarctica TaxID=641691 RepID=A0A831VRR3_9FLAO|nr:hypothetical protein [Pricia antarctica]